MLSIQDQVMASTVQTFLWSMRTAMIQASTSAVYAAVLAANVQSPRASAPSTSHNIDICHSQHTPTQVTTAMLS